MRKGYFDEAIVVESSDITDFIQFAVELNSERLEGAAILRSGGAFLLKGIFGFQPLTELRPAPSPRGEAATQQE